LNNLIVRQLFLKSDMSVTSFSTKSAAGNKYLEKDDDAASVEDEDYNVHAIARTGTYTEVKDAIARDRPRLIALKDEVRFLLRSFCCFSFYLVFDVPSYLVLYILVKFLVWKDSTS
jgi:hypothetical protein